MKNQTPPTFRSNRRPIWLYVLHFDDQLAHAGHYVGITTNLPRRLLLHETGKGARITAAMADKGKRWHLAALYYTHSLRTAARAERWIKAQHGTSPFCPACNATPRKLKGLTEYDPNSLPLSLTRKRN